MCNMEPNYSTSSYIADQFCFQILLPDLVHADFAFQPSLSKKRDDEILVSFIIVLIYVFAFISKRY